MKWYSWSREDFIHVLYSKYISMEEIKNWCLGTWECSTDFLLKGEESDWLPTLVSQDTKIYEYDQSGTLDCTLYSAFGAISDLFNYEFTKKEIDEIVALSYEKGRIKGQWWYIKNAVDLVADYWNEHHGDMGKVIYYRISLYDTELVDKILQKNYTLCSWYNGNAAYNKDRNADAILNGVSFPWATYWHAVSWIGRNGKRYIKDNYKGRKSWKLSTNIYEVEHTPSELVSGLCYFANAYLYVKVDNTEEIKRLEELKTECNNCIESLWKLWHLTNEENFRSILHYTADKIRMKISTCNEMLKQLKG
jgi:hypothetical protein